VKKKALQAQLDELAERLDELQSACGRLLSHAEVVALAVRSRESVPSDDLDDAIDGLHELRAELRGGRVRA
jgi:hypothetical protein